MCASRVISGKTQNKCMVKMHKKRAFTILIAAPDNEQRTEIENNEEEVMEEEQVDEDEDEVDCDDNKTNKLSNKVT